jgi:hypothetical protein
MGSPIRSSWGWLRISHTVPCPSIPHQRTTEAGADEEDEDEEEDDDNEEEAAKEG